MKAIKITQEGVPPIHIPIHPDRQIYVGLTILDEDVSIIANSQAVSESSVITDYWESDEIRPDATITLQLVEVEETTKPDQHSETKAGEPRCTFCGEFESDVGDLYRGTHQIANICNSCIELASNDR